MHSLVAEAHLVWAGTPLKHVPVLSELRQAYHDTACVTRMSDHTYMRRLPSLIAMLPMPHDLEVVSISTGALSTANNFVNLQHHNLLCVVVTSN